MLVFFGGNARIYYCLMNPTNHLDLDMRRALTEALVDYEGSLVVVSHDRHLLRNTVGAVDFVCSLSV